MASQIIEFNPLNITTMPSYKLPEIPDEHKIICKFLSDHVERFGLNYWQFKSGLIYAIYFWLAKKLQKQGILYFVEKVEFGGNR